jgi:hypothetical protein
MNVTLSLDEHLLKRARRRADAMGKSLNELIRDFLTDLTDDRAVEGYEQELKSLSAAGGDRAGWQFNRDEIHERP